MTDLMQLLYDYTLNTGFTNRLNTGAYRSLETLTEGLAGKLQKKLAGDTWDTLEKYQDALAEQRDLELQAMFLSTLALSRELR